MVVLMCNFNEAGAIAQEQESFEGFINGIRANAVKGAVLYLRGDGRFDLEPGHKLEEGDFIKSGADGYAELLLQPGNYVRVGANSDFQIVSDRHDRMRLKLNQGTMMLEILSRDVLSSFYRLMEVQEVIRVITPGGVVLINEPGIFRINATKEGRTEVTARKGEATVNGRQVKQKRRAVVLKENVTIVDIDPKVEDSFDVWSRERADTLVQANKSLKRESPWTKKRKESEETSVDVPEEGEQSNNPYVVSARPGAVNFTEPGVEFNRPSEEWQPLTEKSQLEAGDKLRTDAYSFAELTLFPDLHFRLDGSTEVLFAQLSNDSISLKVLRGSAILDVARFDREELPPITIAGPSTSVVIADAGNYRIDATGDAITVRKGKVMDDGRSIGSCRRIAGSIVADCDKKHTDNFDYWSQHRGEGEFFTGRGTVALVTHLTRLRRLRFRNTGFWFQHPGQTYYTFVPFSSEDFRSPYGGNYSTVLAPRRSLLHRPDLGGRSPRGFPGPQVARPEP